MKNVPIVQGASKRFRVAVPDGRGGYKDLSGHTIEGKIYAKAGDPPLDTLAGDVDQANSLQGIVDLTKTKSATLTASSYRLVLSATLDEASHKAVLTLDVTKV